MPAFVVPKLILLFASAGSSANIILSGNLDFWWLFRLQHFRQTSFGFAQPCVGRLRMKFGRSAAAAAAAKSKSKSTNSVLSARAVPLVSENSRNRFPAGAGEELEF